MSIPTGIYNFAVIPPVGSGFQNADLSGLSIAANTVLNFVLVPSGMVTLSGRVLDGLGVGVPNQSVTISLAGGGPRISQGTDSSGHYAFQVAPGDYSLSMAIGTSDPAAAPLEYQLWTWSTFSLTQNTTMDLRFPVNRVSVHVQDPSGNPVAGVRLSTSSFWNETLMLGDLPAGGWSAYPLYDYSPVTDALGNVTLWLFPTDADTYTFTATPPVGSPWAATNLFDISFNTDTSVTLTLVVPVTLSGRVLDGLGVGVPNQSVTISLAGGGPRISQGTDSSGHYAFQVAPGDYSLSMAIGTSDPAAAPLEYQLWTWSTFSLTQNTTMDLRFPVNRVSVHVQDPSGNPVAGVRLSTSSFWNETLMLGDLPAGGWSAYPLYDYSPVTDALGNVTLWLFPTDADTYTFTATPPVGSPWAATNLFDISFNTDTSVTLTLVVPVTLSGRVLDGLGVGVPNQSVTISLAGGGPRISQGTDSSGHYAFQVAPGDYSLSMAIGTSDPAAAPLEYQLWTWSTFSLTQNTTMDLRFPVNRVSVHVQDPSGNPVAGVRLSTSSFWNETLMLGDLPAGGWSAYPLYDYSPVTDALGNVTLWLFPTDADTYTFTATPPVGSPYAVFAVHDISVVSDMTEVLVLQYEEPPTPTACPLSQGFWKNKVEFWPVNSLIVGSQSYSLTELIEILHTAITGNASLILAHQLIAAKANIKWGSDPTPIADVIALADSLLSSCSGRLPHLVNFDKKASAQMKALAKTLDDYNNRLLTPTCNPLAPTLALYQSERDIQRLRTDVEMLASAVGLKKEKLHQLRMTLDGTILNRENPEAVRAEMLAFAIQVLDLMREAAIPVNQGQRLIEKAYHVITKLFR